MATLSPRYEHGALAKHIYWFCGQPDGTVSLAGMHCAHASCSVTAAGMHLVRMTGLTAAQREAATKTQWAASVTYDCTAAVMAETSDRAKVCAEHRQLFAANASTWMAGYTAPVWRVKTNGAYTDRPVQRISATNGLAPTALRVAVGAPCYHDVKFFRNATGNSYAAINKSQSDLVAVCSNF